MHAQHTSTGTALTRREAHAHKHIRNKKVEGRRSCAADYTRIAHTEDTRDGMDKVMIAGTFSASGVLPA